jgi:hypothetical protein
MKEREDEMERPVTCSIGLILVMLVVCAVLGAMMLRMDRQTTVAVIPTNTPAPTPITVPLEAYKFALEKQAQVARDGFTSVVAVALGDDAARISGNCFPPGVLVLGLIVVLVLLATVGKR